MIDPKAPNLYLVRIYYFGYLYRDHKPIEGRRVWAFSAEDAVFQVENELKKVGGGQARVDYVGPVNPNCNCGEKPEDCRCGVAAR